MNFTIKEYDEYHMDEIIGLYESVGWSNYTNHPEMLKNAFSHSADVLAAYQGDKLVGIIRVVGDCYSILYIQDILILPDYQRQGIGTALMKEILNKYKNVYQKVLLTDRTEKTIAFYKSFGFELVSDENCAAFMKMY